MKKKIGSQAHYVTPVNNSAKIREQITQKMRERKEKKEMPQLAKRDSSSTNTRTHTREEFYILV